MMEYKWFVYVLSKNTKWQFSCLILIFKNILIREEITQASLEYEFTKHFLIFLK